MFVNHPQFFQIFGNSHTYEIKKRITKLVLLIHKMLKAVTAGIQHITMSDVIFYRYKIHKIACARALKIKLLRNTIAKWIFSTYISFIYK